MKTINKHNKEYMKNKLGLRQRILQASSKEEINSLLLEGKKYENASRIISNRWSVAASKRISMLEKQSETKRAEQKKELKQQKKNA